MHTEAYKPFSQVDRAKQFRFVLNVVCKENVNLGLPGLQRSADSLLDWGNTQAAL